MKLVVYIISVILILTGICFAGEYKAKVTNVVDGDTIDCEIDLGFDLKLNSRIRFLNYDAPESTHRAKGYMERLLGLEATDYLKRLIYEKEIILKTSSEHNVRDNFGRILADPYIIIDDQLISITDLMTKEGYIKKEDTNGSKAKY